MCGGGVDDSFHAQKRAILDPHDRRVAVAWSSHVDAGAQSIQLVGCRAPTVFSNVGRDIGLGCGAGKIEIVRRISVRAEEEETGGVFIQLADGMESRTALLICAHRQTPT